MINHDSGEVPLSATTLANLSSAITELRSEDGFLLDCRLVELESVSGVESVCVGESARGQFVVVSNEAGDAGPFLRDIFILDEVPKVYRGTYMVSEEEERTAITMREALQRWQGMVLGMSEESQIAENQRFQQDAARISASLHAYCDISDTYERGDISEEEMLRRREQVSVSYTLRQTDEPEAAAYEAAYEAAARSTVHYQAFIISVGNHLEALVEDIVDNETDNDDPSQWTRVTEASAWNLISILDRATSSTNVA